MMQYLVRFVQMHESFRRPELEALALLAHVDLEVLDYSEYSPFCIVKLKDEIAARNLISRSILSKGIYELWGRGSSYEEVNADIKRETSHHWPMYTTSSFRFDIDVYQGKHSASEQKDLVESFNYLGFNGPIHMKDPDQTFCIFEDCDWTKPTPKQIYFGRFIGGSSRDALNIYTLKKRNYISTTSMDSELALITANITLAGPGKLIYDPFVGTGSFPIACSHFGAVTMGSDLDGRMVRGKPGRNIVTNFQQYGLLDRYLDGFLSDLTYCPLREARILDGIICDPPYGIREGLKVLGTKDGSGKEAVFIDGEAAHLQDKYIPPKKPYSFEAMLADILEFAALYLVDDGRLSLWMPTANDEEVELAIPGHRCLGLVSVCVQPFNKWSRRLLTYRRLPEAETRDRPAVKERTTATGATASDLNPFRKKYFQGFKQAADGTTGSADRAP